MTVRELIDNLKQFNPDRKVVYKNDITFWYYEEVTNMFQIQSKLGPNEETEDLIELL